MTHHATGAVAPANEEAVRAWDTVLYERWKKNRNVFVGVLDGITEEQFERSGRRTCNRFRAVEQQAPRLPARS